MFGSFVTIFGILVFSASSYNYYSGAWTLNIGFYFALVGSLITMMGYGWSVPNLSGRIRELAGGFFWSTGFITIVTLVLRSMSPNGFIPPASYGGLIIALPLICLGMLLSIYGVKMIFQPVKTKDEILDSKMADKIASLD
jgi:hypothetical protein